MKLVIGGAVAIVALFVGVAAWRPQHPSGISWATVNACELSTSVVLVGALMPRQHAIVLPRLPSRVARITARQGQQVKAGEPLLYLDADELRLEHERHLLLHKRARLRARNPELSQDQRELADIEVREAALALLKAKGQLDDSILRSPIDGEVAQLGVRVGDFMTSSRVAGGDGIIIAGTNELVVRTEVEEFAAAQVKKGMIALVRLDAFANTVAKAVIDAEPIIRRTGTDGRPGAIFEVVARLTEAPTGQIRIGTTATVEVSTVSCSNCLCVPVGAVVERDRDMYVLEQVATGVRPRQVKLGINDDYQVEIQEGISAGASVAIGVSSDLRTLAWPAR